MNTDILWNHETELRELGIDVPAWVEQDIDCTQIAAILQGGCESGAYMPAVTYYDARETMHEHGDAVMDYFSDGNVEWPTVYPGGSWSLLCTYVLSGAVERWAAEVAEEAAHALQAREEDA